MGEIIGIMWTELLEHGVTDDSIRLGKAISRQLSPTALAILPRPPLPSWLPAVVPKAGTRDESSGAQNPHSGIEMRGVGY